MKKIISIMLIAILVFTASVIAEEEAIVDKVVYVEAWSDNEETGHKAIDAIDGNITTRWCAQLFDETPCQLVLTFDKAYSFNTMNIAFNKPMARSYYFTLAISMDGENWEMVPCEEEYFISDVAYSNGEFSEIVLPETITAQYLKFFGYGYYDFDEDAMKFGATDPNNGGPLSWFSFFEIDIPVVDETAPIE